MARVLSTGTGRTPARLARLMSDCTATPAQSAAFRRETSRTPSALDPAAPPVSGRPGLRRDS